METLFSYHNINPCIKSHVKQFKNDKYLTCGVCGNVDI